LLRANRGQERRAQREECGNGPASSLAGQKGGRETVTAEGQGGKAGPNAGARAGKVSTRRQVRQRATW